jgi:hypothetical protein
MSRNRVARRLNKESHIKELRKLWEEKEKVFDAICSLGWVELEKPIRDGWVRTFTLRDDFTRRSDKDTYEDLLNIINNKCYCSNKSYLKKNYQTKKMMPIEQYPNELNQSEFDKIPDRLKKFFYKSVEVGYYAFSSYKYEKIKYKLIDTYMFVYKIEKHYKTKIKLIDRNLESEYSRLSNFLSRNNLDTEYYDKIKNYDMKFFHDYYDMRPKDKFNERVAIKEYYRDVEDQ